MATKTLPVGELSIGLVLAEDVLVQGRILLKAGVALTQAHIDRLKQLKIHGVFINTPDPSGGTDSVAANDAAQKQFHAEIHRLDRLFTAARDDCQLHLLRAPLTQHYRCRFGLRCDELEEKVKAAVTKEGALSTLGGMVSKLQEVAADDREQSIQELIKLVESDLVLTVKVMNVVNSVASGVKRHVGSIADAVVLLGFNKLRNLCVGIACVDKLGSQSHCAGFDRVGLWHHALGTALACRVIENYAKADEGGDLFVAGLLCNIGRVILDQIFPSEFGRVLQLAGEKKIRVIDAEREIIGATHAEVGYWAVTVWKMDEKLARTIRDHHGPLRTRDADIVNLAYVLTQFMGIGSPGDSLPVHLLPGALDRLELDESKLKPLLRNLELEYQAAAPILKVMMDQSTNATFQRQ